MTTKFFEWNLGRCFIVYIVFTMCILLDAQCDFILAEACILLQLNSVLYSVSTNLAFTK